jgi:predicted DNA-binding transcriptional regulator AlpA
MFDLLSREQVAAEAGCSVRTIERNMTEETGLKPVRIGVRVYFRQSDVSEWLTSRSGSPAKASCRSPKRS